MGLSAAKRRTKLSHDPNNTSWSKATDNFGHKILAKQGWKPGDYLGAECASHAEHYTAANASHIRVLLREDNLGLGAKIGGNKAETFGLSLFSGVLGRLNGKTDDEVSKQQNAIRDAELRTFQATKYGFMNFVSGGLLIGDKIEPQLAEAAHGSTSESERANRKRKAEDGITQEDANWDSIATATIGNPTKRKEDVAPEKPDLSEPHEKDGQDDAIRPKNREKAWRKALKAERRQKKEAKRAAKAEKKAQKAKPRKNKDKRKKKEKKDAENDSSESSTNVDSAALTPRPAFAGGRHAVRQRYIQQKRLASMDPRAIQEIFMLKGAA